MLYVGIDLHRKQLTVCIRKENGDITCRRQVSTRPHKIREFLDELKRHDFVVLLETCGFEDWLIKILQDEPRCQQIVVVQPDTQSKTKTDRRDANRLCEVLWLNRDRLKNGEKLQAIRRVYIPTDDEQQDRRLTSVRQRLVRQRTRTLNQIHYLLRRHNLEWEQPTKTFQTKKVKQWLKDIELNPIERLELNQLLEQWALLDQHIDQLDQQIVVRFEANDEAQLLNSITGVSYYMGLAIACRIGDISRFRTPRSLANFFGLTPGSRSSGETQRLGSITKQGSRHVRFLLGQLVLHLLRKDARIRVWYQRIKKRRGSKIARVAVMRRLAVILWHMLSKREPYQYGSRPISARQQAALAADKAALVEHRREVKESLGITRTSDSGVGSSSGVSTGSSSLCSTGSDACLV